MLHWLRVGYRSTLLLVPTLLVVCHAPAARGIVLGGGLVRSDCDIAYAGVNATNGDNGVVCSDGDPTCDLDGTVDGICHFEVSLCAHVASDACTAAAVDGVHVSGLPLDVPVLPVSVPTCGADAPIAVPVDTAVGATSIARLAGALKDVDYLNLCCRSSNDPLDAPLCAISVELSIAGCQHPPSKPIQRAWHKAGTYVTAAMLHPPHAKRLLRHAVQALIHVRARARRLATADVCGDTLGMMVDHAIAMISSNL